MVIPNNGLQFEFLCLLNGANRQGLERQPGALRNLVLFAGKSDWNELLCGIAKPGAKKPAKAESPAAGIIKSKTRF